MNYSAEVPYRVVVHFRTIAVRKSDNFASMFGVQGPSLVKKTALKAGCQYLGNFQRGSRCEMEQMNGQLNEFASRAVDRRRFMESAAVVGATVGLDGNIWGQLAAKPSSSRSASSLQRRRAYGPHLLRLQWTTPPPAANKYPQLSPLCATP